MFWSLLLDFGLVVLIWMTQLVVYPSFTHFSETDLIGWHIKYTTAITYLVMPLMVAQLSIHSWALIQNFSWMEVVIMVLIGLAWVNTFLFAVPLHRRIDKKEEVMEAAEALVKVNWYRTAIWTIVFLLGLVSLS